MLGFTFDTSSYAIANLLRIKSGIVVNDLMIKIVKTSKNVSAVTEEGMVG